MRWIKLAWDFVGVAVEEFSSVVMQFLISRESLGFSNNALVLAIAHHLAHCDFIVGAQATF